MEATAASATNKAFTLIYNLIKIQNLTRVDRNSRKYWLR